MCHSKTIFSSVSCFMSYHQCFHSCVDECCRNQRNRKKERGGSGIHLPDLMIAATCCFMVTTGAASLPLFPPKHSPPLSSPYSLSSSSSFVTFSSNLPPLSSSTHLHIHLPSFTFPSFFVAHCLDALLMVNSHEPLV